MKPSRFAATRNGKRQALFIDINMGSVAGMFQGLRENIHNAARPAAQAGAEVLYRAVLRNVQAIGRESGSLAGSIYQKYSPELSGPGKAMYHISWRTSNATLDDKGQPGRTNLPIAPHGHLLEYGYIQRYAVHLGDDGQWYTLVQPKMRGKKKPKRGASQSEKDAYYVLRKGGPVQWLAKPFIRPAASHMPAALEAAKKKFAEVVAYTKWWEANGN